MLNKSLEEKSITSTDKAFAAIQRLGQKCLESMPTIVLGSGSSAAYGIPGMNGLQEHLKNTIKPTEANAAQVWGEFTKALDETSDLEIALQKVQLTEPLLQEVVKQTRSLILEHDSELFNKIVTRQVTLALTSLCHHLFQSTHKNLCIITTNYDRLAEYAADLAKVSFYTGFTRGYMGHFNNTNANQRNPHESNRTVEICKVHGSIDWFLDADDIAISLPGYLNCPDSFTPALVTPGIMKYERTHREPFRTIISNADNALLHARSVLCIGYGFNDTHIQPKLVQRFRDDTLPLVILAKQLTGAAKEFISKCKQSLYLAIESNGNSSTAYFPEHPNGIDIQETGLWSLDGFLNMTIGQT